METLHDAPHYMAPEVIKSKELDKPEYDPKADVWSVGCIFYVILTGRVPFSGNTLSGSCDNIEKGIYSFPKTVKLSHKGL